MQNFVGDAMRGATWVSLHNGGGVGWGEVMNGGFGLVLDGYDPPPPAPSSPLLGLEILTAWPFLCLVVRSSSDDASRRARNMLFWDVNNGIARRAWGTNDNAVRASATTSLPGAH